MEEYNLSDFFEACDDFINCKFLVAEYKLQRMLHILARNDELCSLIGDCLEQFNRDREFAKAFIQDGQGEYVCDMPQEEYKIIAFVFCTLVDIDNKKIDLVEFVKRFFGRENNPFKAFINQMVVPFRDLLAEAFGFPKLINAREALDKDEFSEDSQSEEEFEQEDEEEDDEQIEADTFKKVQKIAVQIVSELQYYDSNEHISNAIIVCKALIKTTDLRDSEITYSLALALRACKAKPVKFLVKELLDLLSID